MVKDPIDAALDKFSSWTATTTLKLSGDADADAAEVRLLLGLIRDHLGLDNPARLEPGDIEELLLRVYPRKVTVLDPADAQETVPALRDLLAFLADTGQLPARAVRALERELDQVAPRFAGAVMDPSRWGMARSFTQAMATDGVDLDDQAAMRRWIADYNAGLGAGMPENRALPAPGGWDLDVEDLSLKQAFGLPDRLPAMRLPAEPELASTARKSSLLAAACRLAEWAGTGRAVDQDGELTAADTVAAAAELGIEIDPLPGSEPRPGEPRPAGPGVTSMRDVPELLRLWNLALGAGFLEEEEEEEEEEDDGIRFTAGAAAGRWREGTDAEALETWSDALTFMVTESLDIDADLDLRRGRELDFYGAGMGLVAVLFLARSEGLQVAEASEIIRDDATGELPAAQAAKAWASWTRVHGDPASVLLDRLAQLGAVTLDDEAEGADGRKDTVARLTPLASWAVRKQFADAGVQVPLLPPPAEMTAADLVAAAEGMSEDEIAAEADAWLALRAPDAAARELLEFAAKGGPVERMVAITAVQRIGAAAEPGWREALKVRAVRPYAKIALTELTAASPEVATLPGLEPEADDAAWLVTDLLVATSAVLEQEDLAIQLGQAVPKGAEELMFDVMWRLPHPDAAQVLTLIGEHHPDKKVAKAARRFAYKASSRLKSVR